MQTEINNFSDISNIDAQRRMPGHWRKPKACLKLQHGVSWSVVWDISGGEGAVDDTNHP